MIGAQKGRGLLWGIDRSKSTKNEGLSGRPKEEVIYEAFNKDMKEFFKNMGIMGG